MKLKTLYLTTLTLLALITLPTIYVAGASSTTFTLSQGAYPLATYTIWKESSTYYAKNTYGIIGYSGTNATVVTNNAITNCPDGNGHVHFIEGTFSFDGTIQMKGDVTLTGTGYYATILDFSSLDASHNGIEIKEDDGALRCELADFAITGGSSDHGQDGIFIDHDLANLETKLTRLHVSNFGRHGVALVDSFAVIIEDVQSYHNGEWGFVFAHSHNVLCRRTFATSNTLGGYNLTAGESLGGAGGGCDGITFYNCFSQLQPIGFQIGDGWTSEGHGRARSTLLSNCHLEANTNHTIIDQQSCHTTILGGMFSSATNYSIVILDGYYTTIVNADLTSYPATITDYYEDTSQYTIIVNDGTGYLRLCQISHPTTTGWGADEAGRMWYCTTHDDVEYWNGTDIVQLP